MNKGSYVIIFFLSSPLAIDKPKKITLKEGYYAYVGSAMNSLTGRIKRHLIKNKKVHWHIDQLSTKAEAIAAHLFVGKNVEEKLSKYFAEKFFTVESFGSSDLKTKGNLFYSRNFLEFLEAIEEFYEKFEDFQL